MPRAAREAALGVGRDETQDATEAGSGRRAVPRAEARWRSAPPRVSTEQPDAVSAARATPTTMPKIDSCSAMSEVLSAVDQRGLGDPDLPRRVIERLPAGPFLPAWAESWCPCRRQSRSAASRRRSRRRWPRARECACSLAKARARSPAVDRPCRRRPPSPDLMFEGSPAFLASAAIAAGVMSQSADDLLLLQAVVNRAASIFWCTACPSGSRHKSVAGSPRSCCGRASESEADRRARRAARGAPRRRRPRPAAEGRRRGLARRQRRPRCRARSAAASAPPRSRASKTKIASSGVSSSWCRVRGVSTGSKGGPCATSTRTRSTASGFSGTRGTVARRGAAVRSSASLSTSSWTMPAPMPALVTR